eukprot:jgi/Mesen1/5511/ME000279S04719
MSGWDEGHVYYTEQGYDQDENVDQQQLSRFQAQRKLKEFIRGFHDPRYNDGFIYRDKLQQNPSALEVDLENLQSKEEALNQSLRDNPADILPLFETAAAEVAASLKVKVAGPTGELEEPAPEDCQVLLTSKEDPITIRALSAGAVPCPLDPWVVLPDRSAYVDQQTLKLQENPEDVPTGEMPRNLLLAVDRSLVQKTAPGARVTVFGIYSIFQSSDKNKNRGAVALRQPYLRVVGMLQAAQGNARGAATFSNHEAFSRRNDVYDEICALIAPSIFGHADVKRAIACLLFGGSRKFLKFVEKTAPIAVYTSGKGSSAAGLTASVIRDPSTREFYLEGGAMVLADGGVVCIDEFDKMRPEDRVAIHEAMEQQTISIAKAGLTTVLNSRTSVLAAANPPSGRYDDLKSAQENIDLQTTILSRFDLIFIAVMQDGAAQQQQQNWLKRYVEFCRSRSAPRLSDAAAALLQNNYVRIRQQMRRRATETGESNAIPITVRQLEAIVRISESIARMQLSPTATPEHVTEALRLFQVSTMDAAQSGIMDHLVVSEEQRAEIQQVESQVKRRLGIGSYISERRLVDELTRMGLNESIVRRALLVMVARDEMEYRKERRVIFRKS